MDRPGTARRASAAAAVLLVLLAGCSAGPPETEAPQEDKGGVKDAKVTPGRSSETADPEAPGTLQGRVRDDVNFSIEGALVALLGTDHSTQSGPGGLFEIPDVAPGTYVVRVNPPSEYQFVEDEITIGPGEQVEVTIVVVPREARGPGFTPHQHNYWGGQEAYTLMDAEYEFRDDDNILFYTYATAYGPNYSPATQRNYLQFYPPSGEPSHPSIVIPGTGKISFTLEWDSGQVTADELGVRVVPNGVSDEDEVVLGPEPAGTPMELDVEPHMWDSPHQAFTLWKFYLYTGEGLFNADVRPTIINGPVQIRIELTKGDDLTIDRPHEDWWGNATEIDIPAIPPYASTWNRWVVEQGAIVPPGAETMTMELSWTYQGTYAPLGDARDTQWDLYWRTGDMPPAEYDDNDYLTASPEACGDNCRTYTVDLEPGQTDAFYQTKSNWEWVIKPPRNLGDDFVDGWAAIANNWYTGIEAELEVTVSRAPPPTQG